MLLQTIPSATSSFTLCLPLKGVLDLSNPICCSELATLFYLHRVMTFFLNEMLYSYQKNSFARFII